MGLQILLSTDKVDLAKEYLALKALKNLNTSRYVVMDTTFDEEGDVANLGRHAYKFPAKEIKEGDFVVLYTRAKPNNWPLEKPHDNGTITTHYFYWERGATVWNQGGDRCTVMKIVDSKNV
ncbi:MAG: hypothetical protein IPI93_06045 [Sphingobacteriaceae bacterium]|nr:hypothetical protein [Sphingobacteriaceae bacterium]